MTNEAVKNFTKNSHIGLIGHDKTNLLVFRQRLQNIGFKKFSEFERTSQLLHAATLQNWDVDIIFILESPKDSSWVTLMRSIRTGSVFSALPIVLFLDHKSPPTPAERDLLKSYHVSVLDCKMSEEHSLSTAITSLFEKKSEPQSIDQQMLKAKHLLQTGLTSAATAAYEQLLKENEGSLVARYGLVLATANKNNRAYWEQLNNLIKQDPENYNFKFEMVSQYTKQNRLNKAQLAIDNLVEELSSVSESFWLNELGIVSVGIRFYALALKLAEMLRRQVDQEYAWQPDLLIARVYVASGKLAEGKEKLNAAIALTKGKYSEIENLAAVIARRSGNHEEALQRFINAYSLSPNDHRILFNAALCCEHLNDIENAKKFAQKVIQLCPSYTRASTLLEKLNKPPIPHTEDKVS